jgi:hypothetical protein
MYLNNVCAHAIFLWDTDIFHGMWKKDKKKPREKACFSTKVIFYRSPPKMSVFSWNNFVITDDVKMYMQDLFVVIF